VFVFALYHVCHQRLSKSLGQILSQIARSYFCGDSIVWGKNPGGDHLIYSPLSAKSYRAPAVASSIRFTVSKIRCRSLAVNMSSRNGVAPRIGLRNSSHGTIVVGWLKDSAHFHTSLATSRVRGEQTSRILGHVSRS
jgi:hypothetical protein